MTFTSMHSAEASGTLTAQGHHLKAAEHLDQASKSHKDAARLMDGGDHKAASSQSKMAQEHAEHAAKHVVAAAQKTSAMVISKK